MNKIMQTLLVTALCMTAHDSLARGGFSGGGGRSGGFSSSRSFSSPSRSFSSPSRSMSSPARTTSVTRTTTVGRYGHPGYYGGYGHPMMMGGFGMGYGYSNGIMTGLILGSLMHPSGTTVYSGGGYSGGQALLYPDGRVVDQNGYQVGTYANGQFSAQAGGMAAQPAPPPVQQAEPVTIYSGWEIAGGIIVGLLVIIAIIAIIV